MKTKVCCKCKLELPLCNFYKHKRGKYGKGTICKSCKREKGHSPERRTYVAGYHKSLKGQIGRKKEILKRHNITLVQYDKMFEQQNGACIICGLPELSCRLCIDHDHETNEIRGLLCRSCNVRLGYFERMKNDGFIKKADRYLKNSS